MTTLFLIVHFVIIVGVLVARHCPDRHPAQLPKMIGFDNWGAE